MQTLRAVAVDAGSGRITANKLVTGYNAWGEMTRLFSYDPTRNVFYLVEANFTGPDPPPGRDPRRPVKLYTINPVTGVATSRLLPGVYNFPTGFAYNCQQDAVIFAVEALASNGTQVGYNFVKVDPTTYKVTNISSSSVSKGKGQS